MKKRGKIIRSVLVCMFFLFGLGSTFVEASHSPPPPPPPPSTSTGSLDIRVSQSSDDAEESASGSVSVGSSDLELVEESSTQTVGVRFQNVNIPEGSTITNAYLQFQTDEVTTGFTNLVIHGVASDNPGTFTSATNNISSRNTTQNSSAWQPNVWSIIGVQGGDQRTLNLSLLVQDIVNRPGWLSGNAMAFVITGTGKRVAESYNGSPSGAPLLHVEWSDAALTPPPPPPPSGSNSLDVRVSLSSDDAEEYGSGTVTISSSDLELVLNGSSNQLVGIRFQGINIPKGSTITNAYVQFKTDETDSVSTTLTFRAHDTDNASAFTTATNNISSRSLTSASVNWSPPAWNTTGEAGLNQRTSNLSSVIQEVFRSS